MEMALFFHDGNHSILWERKRKEVIALGARACCGLVDTKDRLGELHATGLIRRDDLRFQLDREQREGRTGLLRSTVTKE
jgi:hypothetical protein